MRKFLPLLTLLVTTGCYCFAQEANPDAETSSLTNPRFLNSVSKQYNHLQDDIEKKTLKTLSRLEKQERKLQKKLAKKDSLTAAALFPGLSQAGNKAESKYHQLAGQLKLPAGDKKLNEYIPHLDSLKTGLAFLNHSNTITSALPAAYADKLKAASATVAGLEGKLQQANDIKAYIKERRQLLKTELERFGMAKDLKKLNKEAYYYSQQINEYKEALKHPQKIEEKALAALRKLPAFNEFMKKNSQLAQLFRLPDNYGTAASLAGLQTRASVQAQLQQRFGVSSFSPPSGGAGGGYLQQQMQQAQGELSKLKDKLAKNPLSIFDGEGAGGEVDFKPNNQKTKTFLKRLEYGMNIQSQKSNVFLPVTSDIALTAGYKLNDRSVIGIGAAYKLGWGSGWKHIKLSNEGIGLRSYVDWKILSPFRESQRGLEGFWLSGGYEKNLTPNPSPPRWRGEKEWQTSGLLGLTKKYKIGKKTNTMQLLWDFLSYQQVPRRQAVVFRLGVGF